MSKFLLEEVEKYGLLDEVEYDDLKHADDRVKDSIVVLDYDQVTAYELGGVTDWIQLDDCVIYVKNGMIKMANILTGTVMYDTKEIIKESYQWI